MDLDISDEVTAHPSIEMLRGLAAESSVLGNVRSAFSRLATIKYLTEGDRFILLQHAAGNWTRGSQHHYLITIVMKVKGMDLESALPQVGCGIFWASPIQIPGAVSSPAVLGSNS